MAVKTQNHQPWLTVFNPRFLCQAPCSGNSSRLSDPSLSHLHPAWFLVPVFLLASLLQLPVSCLWLFVPAHAPLLTPSPSLLAQSLPVSNAHLPNTASPHAYTHCPKLLPPSGPQVLASVASALQAGSCLAWVPAEGALETQETFTPCAWDCRQWDRSVVAGCLVLSQRH